MYNIIDLCYEYMIGLSNKNVLLFNFESNVFILPWYIDYL